MPLSPDHKAKIAASSKGRVVSDETREKIRQSRLGKAQTDDHKRSLRLAALKRWAKARGEDPDLITMETVLAAESNAPVRKKAIAVPASVSVPARQPEPSGEHEHSPVQVVTAERPAKLKIRLTVAEVLSGKLDASRYATEVAQPRAHSGPTFIDCQCFAGAFTLGATQAGLTLVHKCEEPEGFGMPMCEANRGLLGDAWQGQAAYPGQWEVPSGGADVICANPPCSGFSVMSPSSFRGVDSDINQCMRNLFYYARKVKPHAIIMESVQSAYKIGLVLMRELAESMGPGYQATHVLQNNLSLGGCTERRRYFLVVTDFPFGVESEPMKWVPVTSDAISDLRNLELTWKAQPYTDPPTWWSHRQRTSTGSVDGHQTPQLSAVHQQRLDDIVQGDQAVDWPPGFVWDQVLKRYYEKHGDLPDSHKYMSKAKGKQHLTRDKVMIDAGFNMGGYAQTRHWPWNRPGYVITGHGPGQAWHPDNRHFTHRETARVMGFPDDWLIEPIKDHPQLAAMWGKGISVDCGRWVATWVLNSMQGNPGSNQGKPLPDGTDRVIDVSQDYKKVPGGIRIRGNETED